MTGVGKIGGGGKVGKIRKPSGVCLSTKEVKGHSRSLDLEMYPLKGTREGLSLPKGGKWGEILKSNCSKGNAW